MEVLSELDALFRRDNAARWLAQKIGLRVKRSRKDRMYRVESDGMTLAELDRKLAKYRSKKSFRGEP